MTTESKKLQTIEGFTPGPWVAGKTLSRGSIPVNQFQAGDRLQVAQVNGHAGEQEANAALIAAAPDLYRIAHEQREVIRKLHAALEFSINAPLTPSGVKAANAALESAAPYLEVD